MSVAVVYLARPADGIAHIERFAQSYLRHPAGSSHDLIVIAKGCRNQAERSIIEQIFRGVAARIVEVSDEGRDIQAYLMASQNLAHDHLCFFNTFTALRAPGWLKHLHEGALRPGVGVVGGTASFESIYDSTRFITKATWLTMDRKIRFDARLAAQLAWHLNLHAPAWMAARNSLAARLKGAIEDFWHRRARPDAKLDDAFEKFWSQMTQSHEMEYVRHFPRFPNPHIRTNGFLISRHLLLELDFRLAPEKQANAQFESGQTGLTRRVRALGLKPMLIGANGYGFDIEQWPRSDGFRLGDQRNLIASDNQVFSYDESDEWQREWLTRVSWGDYSGSAKSGFVDLGHEFRVGSLDLSSPSGLPE